MENFYILSKVLDSGRSIENKRNIIDKISKDNKINIREFDEKYRPLTPDEVIELSQIPGIEIG